MKASDKWNICRESSCQWSIFSTFIKSIWVVYLPLLVWFCFGEIIYCNCLFQCMRTKAILPIIFVPMTRQPQSRLLRIQRILKAFHFSYHSQESDNRKHAHILWTFCFELYTKSDGSFPRQRIATAFCFTNKAEETRYDQTAGWFPRRQQEVNYMYKVQCWRKPEEDIF